ncbi:hypothetical protein BDP27DRAFT_1454526 [Rhodocollybia butyracea]|uniref:Uncharacterized protein n=1 Tax=Rhodocollybia butyracea TaxID=206335 RepID=A0A9P5P391_9AGAR|nr:hypothetical protein BDP27DRAFT_1454526 [Rhodocollybia butyracea]
MAPKSSAQKRQSKKTSQPATTTNTTASTSDNERTRTNSGAETSAKEYAPKRGHKESKKDTAAEGAQPDRSAKSTLTPVGGSDEPDDVMSVDGQSSHDIEAGDAGQSSIFSGKFDIYAMGLAFLSSVYLPKGVSQPQYEDLYKTILTYQAEPDFSGQSAIPDLSGQTSGSGSFLSVAFADPFSDKPYDIAIKDMESVDSVSYTAAQQGKKFGTPTMGIPGVYASLSLRDSGCGIQSSKGEFRMSRVWTKNDNGKLIELFEGVMNLRINYGSWECNALTSFDPTGYKKVRDKLWSFHPLIFTVITLELQLLYIMAPPATATTNTTASSSGNKRTRANSGAETSAKEHASKRGRKESTKDTAAEDAQPDQSAKSRNSDITDDVTNVDELSPHDIDDGDVGRSSIFSGKFDIYVVELPFLSSVYLPKGTSQPQYENLYKTILKYQAKPDFTAQCAIPDLSRQTSGSGSLSSVCFADPFSDEPYDIAIENVESVDKVSYTAIQQGKFIGTPTTGIPGVLGNLSLRDSGCGIQSSKGEFRMTRVLDEE